MELSAVTDARPAFSKSKMGCCSSSTDNTVISLDSLVACDILIKPKPQRDLGVSTTFAIYQINEKWREYSISTGSDTDSPHSMKEYALAPDRCI